MPLPPLKPVFNRCLPVNADALVGGSPTPATPKGLKAWVFSKHGLFSNPTGVQAPVASASSLKI
jgi:hypothetical protein